MVVKSHERPYEVSRAAGPVALFVVGSVVVLAADWVALRVVGSAGLLVADWLRRCAPRPSYLLVYYIVF
jgi:hypothetical protein